MFPVGMDSRQIAIDYTGDAYSSMLNPPTWYNLGCTRIKFMCAVSGIVEFCIEDFRKEFAEGNTAVLETYLRVPQICTQYHLRALYPSTYSSKELFHQRY